MQAGPSCVRFRWQPAVLICFGIGNKDSVISGRNKMKIAILLSSWLVFLSINMVFQHEATGQEPALVLTDSGNVTSADNESSSGNELSAGDPAADIVLIGIDSKPFRLSEVIGRGKNVVLIFSRAHW